MQWERDSYGRCRSLNSQEGSEGRREGQWGENKESTGLHAGARDGHCLCGGGHSTVLPVLPVPACSRGSWHLDLKPPDSEGSLTVVLVMTPAPRGHFLTHILAPLSRVHEHQDTKSPVGPLSLDVRTHQRQVHHSAVSSPWPPCEDGLTSFLWQHLQGPCFSLYEAAITAPSNRAELCL